MKKTVLITGGVKGIGLGISMLLAKEGYNIVAVGRSDYSSIEEVFAKILRFSPDAKYIKADISNAEDRKRIVAETYEDFSKIDVLINNAGVAPKERNDILKTTEESMDFVLDINLKGTFFLTQLVSNSMIENGTKNSSPIIINISSISSYVSSVNRGEYCISKAGISMITKLFADRLAEYSIKVFEIRPGIISTDMTKEVLDKYQQLIDDGLTPIKRIGKPDDIGKAVLAICSGSFPFSTGEVFNVDGGYHLRRL